MTTDKNIQTFVDSEEVTDDRSRDNFAKLNTFFRDFVFADTDISAYLINFETTGGYLPFTLRVGRQGRRITLQWPDLACATTPNASNPALKTLLPEPFRPQSRLIFPVMAVIGGTYVMIFLEVDDNGIFSFGHLTGWVATSNVYIYGGAITYIGV